MPAVTDKVAVDSAHQTTLKSKLHTPRRQEVQLSIEIAAIVLQLIALYASTRELLQTDLRFCC
jgi:hypothetical protein